MQPPPFDSHLLTVSVLFSYINCVGLKKEHCVFVYVWAREGLRFPVFSNSAANSYTGPAVFDSGTVIVSEDILTEVRHAER